jgi:pimeloyl-ACP methyl ester carboxylesterase
VCPNKNVTFFLYTRDTQNKPVQLNVNKPKSILKAKYAKGRPLIVLIHGFTGHKDYSPNTQIRPAYFRKDNYNIISVDYKPLALDPCYYHAVSNLPTVANCTAQLLDFMIDNELFTLDEIHVIGFSLGAQTSGQIANFLKPGRKLKRITGLDPAQPLFIKVGDESRLDQFDAEFVE